MDHANINFLAVIVSTVISMVMGAMWYGPLFGKPWMKEVGYTEEDLKKDFNPAKTYGLTMLLQFVIVYVLARLIGYTGAEGVAEGLRLAFLCWIGFTGATTGITYLFERKTLRFFLINSGYHLVVMLIAGVVLTVWR